MRSALVILLGVATLFAGVTLVALEGRDVVVLKTVGPQGEARQTRTWVVEDGGFAWIEAASESRPFLLHIRADPQVEVHRGSLVQRCRAQVLPNPEGHELIRRLLAHKYGWADRWIGMLTDTSGSLAIRLECG